jgi:tetratricopeptide (TPR) repeat protein
MVTWELGLREEALAAFQQSLALVEQMAAAMPADPGVRTNLGRAHARTGWAFRNMGRPAEALRSYERARAIQEPLARENPATSRYQEYLSWTYSNLGVIHLELGHPAVAIRSHHRAMAIHEPLVNRDPGNAEYRNDLGWCWRYLCLALAASGDLGAALQFAERATALYEGLVPAHPGNVELRWRLARCLDEVGRIRTRIGRRAEAAEPLHRAAEIHEALALENPARFNVDLIRNRLYLASQRELSGRHEEALAYIRAVEQVLDQSLQALPRMVLYDIACAHGLWSVAGQDGAIASAEREPRARRAIAALRRAVTEGHGDLDQIRRDPVMDPLRPRADFQELILDLSFPADPFQR